MEQIFGLKLPNLGSRKALNKTIRSETKVHIAHIGRTI